MSPQKSAEFEPLFVDVPTAARMLSVGLTTAWNMVRSGELPSRRFRRCVRVPVQEVERLAATAQCGASS